MLHPRRHPPGFSRERGPGGGAGNVKDGADSWSPAAALAVLSLFGGVAGPPATAASEGVGLGLTLTRFIPILGRSWKEQRKPSRRIRIRRARWPGRAACRISSSFLLALPPGGRFCSVSSIPIGAPEARPRACAASQSTMLDLSEQFIVCVDHVADDRSSGRACSPFLDQRLAYPVNQYPVPGQ
ncbi:hypothetical protein PAHAL_9G428900 [Panicum hallii]|jgi:hypothetical protein|uniref:Uncharacterized protein n=1 Tax=Panicum hallii TaxID=206008 RepID=A0A2T8I4J1_9POAL|nr:hypothetical protein PAHAL_9G428900 [Panicum hallii]